MTKQKVTPQQIKKSGFCSLKVAQNAKIFHHTCLTAKNWASLLEPGCQTQLDLYHCYFPCQILDNLNHLRRSWKLDQIQTLKEIK